MARDKTTKMTKGGVSKISGKPAGTNVSGQSMKRLSLKAGASKLGNAAGKMMRQRLFAHMDELMKDIVLRTELNGLKTIKPAAVLAAIERITGDRIYA